MPYRILCYYKNYVQVAHPLDVAIAYFEIDDFLLMAAPPVIPLAKSSISEKTI